MGYDRLGSNEPGSSRHESPPNLNDDATSRPTSSPNPRLKKLLLLFSLIFLVASAVSVAVRFGLRTSASDESNTPIRSKPTIAISRTCSKTRYPTLCVDSLVEFPGAVTAGERDLVHISVNMTLHRFGKALYLSSEISSVAMNPHVRSAYLDCIELLDDSVDQLARSLTTPESTQDVLTWLSAALTNQDTCTEGLADVRGYVKYKMVQQLRDLAKLVSNCLAIYAAAGGNKDFYGIPIQNRRRRMLEAPEHAHRFPKWLDRRDRVLLNMPVAAIQADIVVAKDGNGTYKTIAEAIKSVPDYNTRRTIIYVKAGRTCSESLCNKFVFKNDLYLHEHKVPLSAASGSGFIARDMTFENWAGPSKHQAVALRVSADHAVVYRCNIIGYQDTLYVHSQRQFFRECDIYGTVDFIFGNAAVVFQNCSIYARKPMAFQKNTITAQNRKDPNQNTGISIHACRIMATSDLEASKGNFSTYLGRPWKLYSRTVFLLSYIGDHVHPRGWLEWNATFALDTLYYGEYMNYGPGSAVGQRVKWPGYRVINSTVEASKFTVAQFIFGSSWLPSTGVAYLAGLSV
ncbi:hypothetical protein RHMOL_Rhmol09G0266400 [Rhododendron molle]|uniref:Uncharacterized protein n=1 Tax=Rhododendron molle TaxID=49168 RepID=A0ACC0MIS1_RHOML|nr:hypothetical protein RHMOL_Rhmol09G0266400 [Rhododendron molle]